MAKVYVSSVIAAPAGSVWSIIRNFNGLPDWAPFVEPDFPFFSSTLDARTLAPVLGTGTGGYSGPALRPIALAAVYACRRASELPIVGMGGVTTGRDALELVAAGASAVALGTVLFADPDAPARIRAELDTELVGRRLAEERAQLAAFPGPARRLPLRRLTTSFATPRAAPPEC